MAMVEARRRVKRRRIKRRRRKPAAIKRRPQPKPVAVAPSPKPSPAPSPSPAPTAPPRDPFSVAPVPTMAATLTPTTAERLFLNRFGTGFSQKSLVQLRGFGSPQAWLEAQLRPTAFAENPKVATVDRWFSSLLLDTPAVRWSKQSDGSKGSWVYGHELGNWAILRRIYSERSVHETMVDFWSANLHIPINHDRAWIWRVDYDTTLRTHAFGRFEDLLRESTLHPAMLFYLDNYRSRKNNPNENHGRELLELHSVGRAAGYTEQMVKDSAKILSGWSVNFNTSARNYERFYDSAQHTTGQVSVLGFSHPNGASDGQQLTYDYLAHLAHHPATARNLARKLAVWFCQDEPSDSLLEALATAYLEADTSISAMLTTLAAHPDFLASAGKKVRTPIQDLVATARVLEVDANKAHTNADGDDSYARHVNWSHQSLQAFAWPRPDGPPAKNSAWSTPSRMFGSYGMHWSHAGGWWPKGAAYKPATYWVRGSGISFQSHVDHLSRRLLGRPADPRLQKTARQASAGATYFNPDKPIDKNSPVHGWVGTRLVATLLDTPDHMLT